MSASAKTKPKPKPKPKPVVTLSPALSDHYSRYDVEVGGLEQFLSRGGGREEVQDGLPSSSSWASSRFVRLNPRFDRNETLSVLKSELSPDDPHPLPVPWLSEKLGFYAVPDAFPLARSPCFREGRIYGMDVSSGAAVAALMLGDYDVAVSENVGPLSKEKERTSKGEGHGPQAPLRVLDLCCSPGLKLCAVTDLLFEEKRSGSTVVGVDISESRLSLCKNIVKKYQVVQGDCRSRSCMECNIATRLYCADGTTYGKKTLGTLLFDSSVAREDAERAGKRKRMNKSARAREKKRLRKLAEIELKSESKGNNGERFADSIQGSEERTKPLIELFDRVLVDAECSTDGAVRHLQQKVRQKQKEEMNIGSHIEADNQKITDQDKLAKLVQIQRSLIKSGFQLLKPGGIMVYSTCSLSTDQNEGVVEWFLNESLEESFIIPISFLPKRSLAPSGKCQKGEYTMTTEGTIPGTVRFQPNLDGKDRMFGGGFFLAKLGKSI